MANGSASRVIAGYEVTRFGVPMIGEYVNTGRGRRVTISPAVPGSQYRITAWALGNGTRSATPAGEYVTTGEASEFSTECILDLQFVHRHKKYSIMHTRTLRVIFCAHTVHNTISFTSIPCLEINYSTNSKCMHRCKWCYYCIPKRTFYNLTILQYILQ